MGTLACLVAGLTVGCAVDRTPVAGLGTAATSGSSAGWGGSGGTAGSAGFGSNDGGSGQAGSAGTGGTAGSLPDSGMPDVGVVTRCSSDCPAPVAPALTCCTRLDDVTAGRAQSANQCGLDLGATVPALDGLCMQRDQPGVIGSTCPNAISAVSGAQEQGCCSAEGRCGTLNGTYDLGCHYNGAPGGACGAPADDIDRSTTCAGQGVWALRGEADVYWGGRNGGLIDITEPGRGRIKIYVEARIASLDSHGNFVGTYKPCQIEIPQFFSQPVCEAFAAEFPNDIWDRPSMPYDTLSGRFHCLHPGCKLSINETVTLLGINLLDPRGAWPTPTQSQSFACTGGAIGEACFPDLDADGFPGMTVRMRTSGQARASGCVDVFGFPGGYDYAAPPLSSDPFVVFNAVQRADRIFLGTRSGIEGSATLAATCSHASGTGSAKYFQPRGTGCLVQEGTAGPGGLPAGPEQHCDETQRAFMDLSLPQYTVMQAGDVPPAGLALPDNTPSRGFVFSLVRLGDIQNAVSCDQVRGAPFPTP